MNQRVQSEYPRFGEVYYMHFDGEGSVQRGWRPGMVYSNNVGNRYSPNIIALPFTTAIKKINQPTHVFIPGEELGQTRDSMVLCENPTCIPKDAIGDYLGTVPDVYLAQIAVASTLASCSVAFLDEEQLITAWREAARLNSMVPA